MSGNMRIAAAAMEAQNMNVRVIADNIANSNTVGFKQAIFFTETNRYEDIRGVGVKTGQEGEIQPVGLEMGTGARPAAVVTLHQKGEGIPTGNPYDMMIRGHGLFQLEGPEGKDVYTYAGNFTTNAQGELVNLDGYKLKGNIVVPPQATEFIVNRNGEIFAKIPGQKEPQSLGQVEIARFHNPGGLQKLAGTLFAPTPASGEALLGVPGTDGFGEIVPQTLESSSVNMIKSVTDLIQAQRAYEMNSRAVQAADEMQKRVEQLGA